jgi:hypothetical protein
MLKKFLWSGSCPTLQRLTKLDGTSTDVLEIFGSAGALPSRKKPFATRYSPFVTFLKILLVDAEKKACYNGSSALRVLTPEKGRANESVAGRY